MPRNPKLLRKLDITSGMLLPLRHDYSCRIVYVTSLHLNASKRVGSRSRCQMFNCQWFSQLMSSIRGQVCCPLGTGETTNYVLVSLLTRYDNQRLIEF